MKPGSRIRMLLQLVCIFSFVPYGVSQAVVERPRGVSKSMGPRYQITGDEWTCLDGSKTIKASSINDDYCDCPDGSDEPGTSACPNGKFHCTNAGHRPAYIRSSRVNDGFCEPECCDGSDEWDSDVTCPNRCKEIGAEARKRAKEQARIRKEGVQIKNSYIHDAAKRKIELKANLERLKIELVAAEDRVASLQELLRQAEKKAEEAEEHKKTTETYKRIQEYKEAIKALQTLVKAKQSKLETLTNILKDLKEKYNPNGQDMAVKAAVIGFEEYENKELSKMEEEDDDEFVEAENFDGLANEDWLPEEFYGKVSSQSSKSVPLIYRIEEYLPDSVHEYYEMATDVLLKSLIKFGLIEESGLRRKGEDVPAESNEVKEAREAFNAAERETEELKTKITDIEKELNTDFGIMDEWRKLYNECFDFNTPEFTYSVCLFDKAEQKSNNDQRSTVLGHFSAFTGPGSKGEPSFYTRQLYDKGVRCWNGPERSVKIDFECGIETKLLGASEPEKCEYHYRMMTPVVCDEGERKSNSPDSEAFKKDEL